MGFQGGEAIDKLLPEMNNWASGLFSSNDISKATDYKDYQEPIPAWMKNREVSGIVT